MGKYPPPQSNESYGTTEASLIQNNGDPATDLLYTANWAFIGLYEAAISLGDPDLKKAAEKMAEFFCRIQVVSNIHPELDGSWMRSFDFQKWEYWGSSADVGWGAWCVESGWVNSWISTTLMLMQSDRSLLDLSLRQEFMRISPEIIQEMFTDQSEFREPVKSSQFTAPGAE